MTTEMREMRERAVYPVLIPMAAVVLVEIVVFSMSRVLLFLDKTPASVFALAVALGILVGAAFIAARPRLKTASILGLLTVLFVATVAAGGYAMTQKPAYERHAEASRPEIDVAAADLVFDTDELTLTPGGTIINFANEDSQPHNIAIYTSKEDVANALFKGEIINGGASAVYEVGAIEAGEYYFRCDVHPTMEGNAVVAEGGAAEGGADH